MKIPKYVYHITHNQNVDSILSHQALTSSFNAIYACPTIKDIVTFAPYIIKSTPNEYVLLKISTQFSNPENWAISYDHNRKFINADSLVYKASHLYFKDEFELISLGI